MSLKDTIIKIFRKNTPKGLADGIAQSYNARKENGEENPIDNTVEEIMRVIKENKNPTVAKEILKGIIEKIEQQEIPNRVLEKASVQISKTDKIPDSIVSQAVEESDVDISDNVLDYMIQEGDFEIKDRLKLIKSVEDTEVFEEHIENEFKILYKFTEKKTDSEIVDRIEEIENMVEESEINIQLRPYIQQVISKKMAENFYSDIKKGTKIYTFSRVMPEEEMIEFDLPSSVKEEYDKLEEENPDKKNRFDLSSFKIQILEEMGKKIAYAYRENGKFIIPQSKSMQNITKEEEERFIATIQSTLGNELKNIERIKITNQIHGIKPVSLSKEEIFRKGIKINETQENTNDINFLVESLKNEETLATYKMLAKSGIIQQLNGIPEELRKETIQTISQALEKGKYQETENSKKIKNTTSFDEETPGEENR